MKPTSISFAIFQQLVPEITAETTSWNATIETCPSVPTDIQTSTTINNQNDTSNFSILKIEILLSVLNSYVGYEPPTLSSKIDAFSDSPKNALSNLQKRERGYSNTDLLQQNITCLENKLKSKDKIIQSLLETQNALTSSLSNLKAKQPKPIVNLSQQEQQHHQKYHRSSTIT